MLFLYIFFRISHAKNFPLRKFGSIIKPNFRKNSPVLCSIHATVSQREIRNQPKTYNKTIFVHIE